ncbi:MAG: permease-like cell division protein FtsX [Gammaproteobacteria bacterium]|nr:permease-like cell division protein FtsX [Gammaproteobacteria bacterium]
MKRRSKTATAPREGASQSRTGWRDRLRSWFLHHRLSAVDSLRRLLTSPFSSLLTWMVIGIALALPVGMAVALDNARSLSSGWDSPAQVSLFLRSEMSSEAARRLEEVVRQREDVAATRFVSREDALKEFQQLSGFADVLRHLDDNPLPNLIVVSPSAARLSAESARTLQTELAAQPGVERAILDMEWVQRLNSLMQLSRCLVTALGALLALGVLLVIGNTIRLAIENRREEIVIIKLVGGSDAFVRRPFLYTGLWYGLGGALISWAAVSLTLWWLRQPLSALALLYQSNFSLQGLGPVGGLQLLALGGSLGLFGAWLAVARHLKAIQPG